MMATLYAVARCIERHGAQRRATALAFLWLDSELLFTRPRHGNNKLAVFLGDEVLACAG
jgi:hypothetical protein